MNRKKGVTLVELIVAIAIMSIIGVVISLLFTSTYISSGIPVKNEGTSLTDSVPITHMEPGFTTSFKFIKSSNKSVKVIIDILKNGAKVYSLDTDISNNNLGLSNVSGVTEGQAIEYTTPPSSPILVNSISVSSSSDIISIDKGTL